MNIRTAFVFALAACINVNVNVNAQVFDDKGGLGSGSDNGSDNGSILIIDDNGTDFNVTVFDDSVNGTYPTGVIIVDDINATLPDDSDSRRRSSSDTVTKGISISSAVTTGLIMSLVYLVL